MTKLTRRQFSFLAGGGVAATTLGMPFIARAANPKVVVIGGGAGGGTAARYIAKDSKGAVNVTLIEPSKQYYTCFFSNLYLGGFRDYASIGHTYENMAKEGVGVVHDWAEAIDRDNKVVRLASGGEVPYDRLVVSPGIDIQYDAVPGYSVEASNVMPHAWKSGTQVQMLKARIEAMPEGGTFIMVAPPNPYRCPPGPYERISMIAHLLKEKNPKAKIIVLDPKEKFSKQSLFQEGWERHYSGMVEWLPGSITGPIENVDVASMTITAGGEKYKCDAASIIPAQKAGTIAQKAGLTDDKGWCPIKPETMQSAMDENIHVIGDASVASAMPKSAFSANSQAKVAANAVRGALTGSRVFPARFANTCWSLIATNDGVKVGAAYKAGEKAIEVTSNFISKTGEDADLRKQTYEELVGWYDGISKDIFG